MNRNAGRSDSALGNSPGGKIGSALFVGREIMFAGGVAPQPVRVEIGRHNCLRRIEPARLPEESDDLRR